MPQPPALGGAPPTALVAARRAAHFAAQPLAAAAYTLLPTPPDHAHANLLWSRERGGFVGRPLPSGARAFLDLAGLRVGLVGADGREGAALELAGATLAQARARFAALLRAAGEEVPVAGLAPPPYELPDDALARGGTFPRGGTPELAELARWFACAADALGAAATELLGGAELRGWPHHFDLAALRTLEPDADPERARSVGAGFSPGDDGYAQPYFYVSPWPAPPPRALPELAHGLRWHTDGFTSAVLLGERVVAAGGEREQRALVAAALQAGIGACLELAGERGP